MGTAMASPSMMDIAIDQARAALKRGEVPVGAVVSRNGSVIAMAGNETRARNDPSAHAELLAIRHACETLGVERLTGCDLHVTLEPCTMCAGAISFARIGRLYFGATDDKGGAVVSGVRFFHQPTCHHAPQVYPGIGEVEARTLLTGFFETLRDR